MMLTKTKTVDTLIDAFNASDSPSDRYAIGSALRSELANFVKNLDETILPIYHKCVVADVLKPIKG